MSRKPRGLRVNKPELPEIYIPGHRVEFWSLEIRIGYIIDPPIWTHDGYWEMDIQPPKDMQKQHGVIIQIVWNPKTQKWIHKTF